MDIEYYREELNKDITMGEIGLLYYEDVFRGSVLKKIIASTILMLHIKKYIKIETEQDQETVIIFKENEKNMEPLKESEKFILNCLKNSDINNDGKIKTRELKIEASALINKEKKKIKESIVRDAINNEYIDEDKLKKRQNHFNIAVTLLIGILFAIGFGALVTIIFRNRFGNFRYY